MGNDSPLLTAWTLTEDYLTFEWGEDDLDYHVSIPLYEVEDLEVVDGKAAIPDWYYYPEQNGNTSLELEFYKLTPVN